MSDWLTKAAAKGLKHNAGGASVIDEIAAERRRRAEVGGCPPEWDDRLIKGELLNSGILAAQTAKAAHVSHRRAEILRSVLLLVAEIERLDRAEAQNNAP